MEKKQLLNNNNGFVGFYPNIHIPFYQLQINIGSYESEEEFNIEETINLDDTFIDIYNKCEEGQNTTIRLDIISDTLESGSTTPIFNGYKGNSSLYFQSNTIINSGKDNENTLIRNLKITNIDVIAKTANINFVQKSVNNSSLTHLLQGGIFHVDDYNENESFAVENIPITLEDSFINTFNKLNIGDFCSLAANIKYKNIILLFRSDNADYIGVKCSYNSCRFNGYVYNFSSNDNYLIDIWITNINTTDKTATLNIAKKIINLISSGDGNKYLSDDGTYKEVTSDKFILDIVQLQEDTISQEYYNELKEAINNNKIFILDARPTEDMFKNTITSVEADYNITNSGCITIILSQVRYSALNKGNSPEINLNRYIISENDYSITYTYNAVDLSNYLTKTNTSVYTPTGDYNPATKKYVDEQIASIEGNNSNVDNVPAFRLQGTINSANASEGVILADIYRSGNTDIIDNLQDGNYVGVLIAIDITDSNDSKQYRGVISGFVRKNMTSGEEIILTTDLSTGGLVFNTVSCPQKINYSYDDTNSPNSLITEFQNISLHKGTTCELLWKYTRRVLTESEYAALGTAPETDNVLYFVTPD